MNDAHLIDPEWIVEQTPDPPAPAPEPLTNEAAFDAAEAGAVIYDQRMGNCTVIAKHGIKMAVLTEARELRILERGFYTAERRLVSLAPVKPLKDIVWPRPTVRRKSDGRVFRTDTMGMGGVFIPGLGRTFPWHKFEEQFDLAEEDTPCGNSTS